MTAWYSAARSSFKPLISSLLLSPLIFQPPSRCEVQRDEVQKRDRVQRACARYASCTTTEHARTISTKRLPVQHHSLDRADPRAEPHAARMLTALIFCAPQGAVRQCAVRRRSLSSAARGDV